MTSLPIDIQHRAEALRDSDPEPEFNMCAAYKRLCGVLSRDVADYSLIAHVLGCSSIDQIVELAENVLYPECDSLAEIQYWGSAGTEVGRQ
jgi:hypothetical protein